MVWQVDWKALKKGCLGLKIYQCELSKTPLAEQLWRDYVQRNQFQ